MVVYRRQYVKFCSGCDIEVETRNFRKFYAFDHGK